MYIISPLIILFPHPLHPLIIPPHLPLPNNTFLHSNYYNQIFTTHPTIIIIFMPIPFLIPLINLLLPLQIPPPHLPFPYFNNLSFSAFFLPA
ncbi:cbb3-type cytochrome c oxidase subunit I, partial [Bacillus subtilis]|uniref:cbb3-type cytochrome c oxidase subunit I n=1 Tax=Bacillus subtilis TaxID=1423 RepID=UPI003F4D2D69